MHEGPLFFFYEDCDMSILGRGGADFQAHMWF